MLVIENMYINTGWLQSSRELRRYSVTGWGELVLCLLGVSYSDKSTGVLNTLVGDNEGSSLEAAKPTPVKARDPLLLI